MKKSALLLFAIMLAFGCASKKEADKFEKVVFHTSRCFGDCPVYHLQVNNDKTFLLSKEESVRSAKQSAMGTGQSETDYFKGKVRDEDYSLLLSELEKTDSLKFKGENCCDAPLRTIISYYNGKRKYVQTMFPPEKAKPLIEVLMRICKSENLTPTEKFVLEGPVDDPK
ncbi:MAG TPA: DUF6438 domain-containing protein [Flavobacterium sp.]